MITIPRFFTLREKGMNASWAGSNHGRDGNIRYYEFENDEFWPLAEYKSSDPQRGVAFMPKRALSVTDSMGTANSL